MKFFQRKKNKLKSIEEEKLESEAIGFLLWKSKEVDFDIIMKAFRENQINAELREGNTIVIVEEGQEYLCTFLNQGIPFDEIEEATKWNYLAESDKENLLNCQSCFLLTKWKGTKDLQRENRLFATKVCAILLTQDEGMGISLIGNGLLITAEKYVEIYHFVLKSEGRFFPASLWVRFFLYQEDGKKMARTYGLETFGLHELCFYNTKREPQELHNLLLQLSVAQINGEMKLGNRQLLNLGGEHSAVLKLDVENNLLHIIG